MIGWLPLKRFALVMLRRGNAFFFKETKQKTLIVSRF